MCNIFFFSTHSRHKHTSEISSSRQNMHTRARERWSKFDVSSAKYFTTLVLVGVAGLLIYSFALRRLISVIHSWKTRITSESIELCLPGWTQLIQSFCCFLWWNIIHSSHHKTPVQKGAIHHTNTFAKCHFLYIPLMEDFHTQENLGYFPPSPESPFRQFYFSKTYWHFFFLEVEFCTEKIPYRT